MDEAQRGRSPLAAIIAEEIRRANGQVITFARFMELALYHPHHGYYFRSRNNPIIGRSGDFFTSVSAGPLFGQLLAFYLAKQFTGAFTIVEAGANDGTLARDILDTLPPGKVAYRIVEPSSALQARQRELLKGREDVSWHSSVEELPPIDGAFVSNELLDAFACHILRWNAEEKRWGELGVIDREGDFSFLEMAGPPQVPLPAGLQQLQDHLPNGYTVEVCPDAEAWWRRAAGKVASGLMLAVDYGDEEHQLWTPNRPRGTLRAYREHRLADDVLSHPGEQDLTAHVNFTSIVAAGEAAGLTSSPLEIQGRFLTKIASELFSKIPPTQAQVRQLQTLTHPAQLGQSFKVLVQRRQ